MYCYFRNKSTHNIPTHDIFAQATGFSDSISIASIASGPTYKAYPTASLVQQLVPRSDYHSVYFNENNDPRGTYCMTRLFMEPHPKNCTLLGNLFPPGLNETTPPIFKVQPGPYWCSSEFTTSRESSHGVVSIHL